MSSRLDRSFGVMGAAALALIAALIVLSLRTAGQLREDVADLDRARDLQVKVQDITATLLDLETSQRGYMLTLDPAYLEPYRTGLARLDQELGSLTAATAERDDESAQVRLLRGLIDAKREELARTIGLADTQGVGAALAVVRENRGKAMMDDIRRALGHLGHQVVATQAQQRAAQAASIGRNDQIVVLLLAMLAMLLVALLVLLRRDKSQQARIRTDEATARERLERCVSDRTAELQATTGRLALSEDRLRRIFESASEDILTTDAAQVIVEANTACAQMFRCEVSDLIGAQLGRLIPTRHRSAHRLSVDAFGAGAVSSRPMRAADGHREVMALRFDGEEFPIDASISRTEVDGQRLYTVIHRDLTEQRRVAAALRDSEARQIFLVRLNDRLRELDDPSAIAREASRLLGEFAGAERVGYGQHHADGQFVTAGPNHARGVPGLDGRFGHVSPAILERLRTGRTQVRHDIAGDPTLTPEEKSSFARQQIGAAVAVPLMQASQLHAVFFVHSVRARAWKPEEVALFEDVARRTRADITRAIAQAAERAASARLSAALKSMTDAVFISDADGRFVDINEAFVSFHRFRSQDECRRTLAEYAQILEVFMADGTPAPLDRWAVPRALRGEVASNVEYRLRRRDTGETWVGSYSFAPIRAEDGHIVGSVISGRDITHLKKTQEDLATSHAALQHLIANQQQVQEDERKRIARELHDDLQQALAAIRMDAVAIGERIARGRGDVEPLLARIDRLSGAAIDSARRIVSDLRPEMLEELGLLPALEALCAEHARRSGVDCRFESSGTDGAAHFDGPVLSVGLFRIAQEALNNVAKHARASAMTVGLDATESGFVTLRISDNGIGIGPRDSRDPGSFGLLGMAERARSMGGQLRIQDHGGRGTVIEVMVPILDPGATGTKPGAREPAPHMDGDDPPRGLGVWDVWGRPLQVVIDALDGHVAVLGRDGAIQLVNRAWREFAAGHGNPGLEGCGPGVDYLDVCRRSTVTEPSAAKVLQGLSAVLESRDESFSVGYTCDTPAGRRWFRMHAASITGGLAIVSHVEITSPAAPASPEGPPGGVRQMPWH